MKTILSVAFATIATASTAIAGSIAYVAPEVTMIEEPATMGGSGSWLIPLIIIAVLALALTNNEAAPTSTPPVVPPVVPPAA